MSISERELGNFGTLMLSTEDVPARARAAYWRKAIRGPYPELNVDWLTEHPIQARVRSSRFAGARVTDFAIWHSPVRVRRKPVRSRDGFQLVLQLARSGRYDHAGHEVAQEPGDMVLLDNESPFDSMFPAGLRVLVWDLPREALAPLLPSCEHAVSRRIAGGIGAAAVLKGHMLTLANQADHLDAITQDRLLLNLCQLAAIVLGAGSAAPGGRPCGTIHRSSRRQHILAFIEANFRDGRLSAARAAYDLGISERWLHALFEEEKIGFAACVAQRRVVECKKLLDDPANDHLSITEIAFRCGFNELSTFNRRFRARYAMTPRDARRLRTSS